MSRDVVTVDTSDPMTRVAELMKHHQIGILPVMNGTKVAGVITDDDLKRASASNAINLEINELHHLISTFNSDPITVSPDRSQWGILFEKLAIHSKLLYMVDFRENRRVIYEN
jgi:acetoin utilization protein AcuB